VSIVAPPRRPRNDDTGERAESAEQFDRSDQLELLIEEARQRARRRRIRNGALALAAVGAVALGSVVGMAGLRGGTDGGESRRAGTLPSALRDAEIIVTGYPEAAAERVMRWTPDGVEELDLGGSIVGWSRDGTRLLLVRGYGLDELDILDANGEKLASIPTAHGGDGTGETAVWSPDGSRVAYAAPPGFSTFATERYRRLFVMDADGANARRLPYFVLGGPPFGGNISWAPGGDQIAFAGRTFSKADLRLRDRVRQPVARSIFVLNLAGSEPARRLPIAVDNPSQPTWSPDGRLIAFTHTGVAGAGVYVMGADGGKATLIAPGGNHPLWSPDGSRLAYRASERFWTVRRDGLMRRALPPSASGVSWSPDGSMLVYVAAGGIPGAGSDVFVVRADGTHARRILHSETVAYQYPIWRGGTSTIGGE
jgi:Tol biopolymer transport system component